MEQNTAKCTCRLSPNCLEVWGTTDGCVLSILQKEPPGISIGFQDRFRKPSFPFGSPASRNSYTPHLPPTYRAAGLRFQTPSLNVLFDVRTLSYFPFEKKTSRNKHITFIVHTRPRQYFILCRSAVMTCRTRSPAFDYTFLCTLKRFRLFNLHNIKFWTAAVRRNKNCPTCYTSLFSCVCRCRIPVTNTTNIFQWHTMISISVRRDRRRVSR